MNLFTIIAIALAYCGSLAGVCWLGAKTADRLKKLPSDTSARRFVRSWKSWCAVSCALFLACILATMADRALLAVLLVVPYAYSAAVGIYREPPVGSRGD